jgi:pilus assembly protein FimV
MKTVNRISTATILAAASLTFSSAAWSLGLGDVTVESFLNQPLQVKIDLVGQETSDMGTVSAKLASAEDYKLIGANREAISVPIRFTIEDIEGDAYILGTSNLPMGNPVVRLIVEVNWSSGRLLREYTVFLDPPTLAQSAPIPRVDKRKQPRPVPETVAKSAESPAPALSQTQAPAPEPVSSSTPQREPVDGEYGPVSSGETLWGIASDWSRGTGLEMNKVMIAIQRENPAAFLKNNINLLKRGAILRMPGVDDVKAMSTASAISEVAAQTDEFRGRKPVETVASPATPLLAEETAAPETPADVEGTEELAENAEIAVEPIVEEPEVRDQLELVPPSEASDLDSTYGFEESEESSVDVSVEASSLRENLARKEEELITQQQQNEYLADRITELETQLAAAEEKIVEDADLGNMQDRLREERLAEAAAKPGEDDDKPWYSHFYAWLIGLLVLVVALVGWLMSRRGGTDILDSGEGQFREIKDEAEEVLRVLEESTDEATKDDTGKSPETSAPEKANAQQFGASSDDAEVLDEESSDPEIQLDLARAYISMGDKEAARVILEEVGSNGSDEQREEAKKMLELLTS